MPLYRADGRQLARAYYNNSVAGVELDITLADPVAEKAELVEIVRRKVDEYSGEYYQGEGEISAVFRVGYQYFRQYGYLSSYGDDDPTFDGRIEEVTPIQVNTTNYEAKK